MAKNTAFESMTYRFGEFELNLALAELHAAGEVVEVQKRVFDLLVFLLQNRDRTVSKDELQDAVWPGTVISETALTRAVMKARRAVGDDATQQKFIKTLHGQGYRFVASVEERVVSAVAVEPSLASDQPAPPANAETQASAQELTAWRVERRNVMLRLATTYGAAAWLFSQVATMLWEAFEWDKLPLQWIITLTLVGFPLVLGIGWFYRATPTGLKLRSESTFATPTSSSKWPYVWVIGMLTLALALSIGWNWRGTTAPVDPSTHARVAILPTQNLTADSTLNWVGLGMSALLTSQLADADLATLPVGKVLRYLGASPDSVLETPASATEALIETLGLAEGVGVVLETQLSSVGGRFVATGRLLQAQEVLALPEFSGAQPSEAVRSLGAYVVKYLQPRRSVDGAMLRVANTGDPFTDQAYARGMHEKISGNMQQAKELLEVAAQGGDEAFWPAYELALSIAELGDLDDANQRYQRLLERAVAQASPLQIAVLSNALGISADLRGDLEQSKQHYEEGIKWAGDYGLHQKSAQLWINYAVLERARAQPALAREYLGRAFSAYERAGVEVLPGDFYITLGNIAADTGDVREAQQQYSQALTNFRRLDRPAGAGIALSNLSWASQMLGELDTSERYLAESIAVREEIGDTVGLVKSEIRQAGLAYSRGKLTLANSVALKVSQTPYVQQEQELLASAHNTLGFVALDRGEIDNALQQFQLAFNLERAGGRVFGQLNARIGLAKSHLANADLQQARQQTALVLDSAQAESMPKFALQAMQVEAQILQLERELPAAVELLEQAIAQASQVGEDRMQALLATDLANLALDQKDPASAEAWAGTASQLLPNDGRVRLLAARLAYVKQEPAKAEQLVAQAQDLMGERIQQQAQALLVQYAQPAGS